MSNAIANLLEEHRFQSLLCGNPGATSTQSRGPSSHAILHQVSPAFGVSAGVFNVTNWNIAMSDPKPSKIVPKASKNGFQGVMTPSFFHSIVQRILVARTHA